MNNFDKWEFKFVLTGGPCAGKTTALSVLEQVLTAKGYKVMIVPETATELITTGITPWELTQNVFQDMVLSRSFHKEEMVGRAAWRSGKDVVIFYDRGIMDGKAYTEHEAFKAMLHEYGYTETEARDRYDAVFHLVTAADGAEESYTLANNKARTETPEQARIADLKTRNAWIGHPHLRVIDNSTPFKEKIDRLIKEVFSVMGLPVPVEIERKYLIKKPDIEMLEKTEGIVKTNILQTYLKTTTPGTERRVRQRGDGSSFSYFYTEKVTLSDLTRQETERKITVQEYLSLLLEGEKKLRKDRYCFVHSNQYFELDVYPEWEDEAILEIELTEESQEVDLPDWISVIKEVTGDENYKNVNLAK